MRPLIFFGGLLFKFQLFHRRGVRGEPSFYRGILSAVIKVFITRWRKIFQIT